MASTETNVCNLALIKMGQETIDSIDGTDALEVKCGLLFDQARDELLVNGPEGGWRFARMTYHGIDDHNVTVSSIAQNLTDITITTSSAHSLVVGDMVELDGDTGYDGEYDVTAVGATTTFDVTATYVATGTGTAHWRSDEYTYRYAIPTSKAVLAVKVGGTEITDWVEQGSWILTNEESSEVDMVITKAVTDVTLFPDHFVKVLVLKLALELTYNINQDLKAIQLLNQEFDLAMTKAKGMEERGKYVKEYSSSWQDVGNNQEVE
jgi:hypothetical protein